VSARRALAFVVTLGLIWGLADQVSKYLAVAHLTRLFPEGAGLGERLGLYFGTDHLYRYATGPYRLIDGLWHHVYVENPAGAFGLLRGAPLWAKRTLFLGVASVATLGLLWMAARARGPRDRLTRVWLGLIFGGALGNLLDRAVHGYVIDFIDWHWRRWHWPAFNLADVGIVLGVFGLLLFMNPATQAADPALPLPPEGDDAVAPAADPAASPPPGDLDAPDPL